MIPALRRLRDDFCQAVSYLVFCVIGGSVFVPRAVRRGIYLLAGADVKSGPGSRFIFIARPRNLTIGRGTGMSTGVLIDSGGAAVRIGDGCILSEEVMIITSHHPAVPGRSWAGQAVGRPVTVGDRVWIGARVILLPGATVESDVVIAAGAVVPAGTLRSGGLYAGVPAKRVRDLLGES